jgi:hypothetical protein
MRREMKTGLREGALFGRDLGCGLPGVGGQAGIGGHLDRLGATGRATGRLLLVKGLGARDEFDRAVVIAVTLVWMVQVTIDQVVDVVAVRHGFVAAIRAVNVTFFVTVALMVGSALRRVLGTDFQDVLFDGVAGGVVQVTVVQVIYVVAVLNSRVAAVLAVLMGVVFAAVVVMHKGVLSSSTRAPERAPGPS